ncbi:MAG TPA: hypothetical protein VJ302_08325 [Blastocatellia bacterium]|nr:hypothetical protein [Blastocatellia bacterium]
MRIYVFGTAKNGQVLLAGMTPTGFETTLVTEQSLPRPVQSGGYAVCTLKSELEEQVEKELAALGSKYDGTCRLFNGTEDALQVEDLRFI